MKVLNKLAIASLTAVIFSNNVNAEEILFSNHDLNTVINQVITVAVTDVDTLNINTASKQQLATMNLEQHVRQFLALGKIEENDKPTAIPVSE